MAAAKPCAVAAHAHDPDVEGFLALLAARRAPRTVDAYRRDLAQLAAWRGGRVAETRRATAASLP